MEGRHVHPSTLYPGGVGTMPEPTTVTDYLVRLLGRVAEPEGLRLPLPDHERLG